MKLEAAKTEIRCRSDRNPAAEIVEIAPWMYKVNKRRTFDLTRHDG